MLTLSPIRDYPKRARRQILTPGYYGNRSSVMSGQRNLDLVNTLLTTVNVKILGFELQVLVDFRYDSLKQDTSKRDRT